MTCTKCGGDVRVAFAGSVEVLRHEVAPRDPHYPRLAASRSGPQEFEVVPRPQALHTVDAVPATQIPTHRVSE